MVLISIVIALALEKFIDIGRILCRFTWFGRYVGCSRPLLTPCIKIHPMLAVAVAVLLPVIVVGLLYCLIQGWIFGLLGWLMSTAILIYCLGPATLYQQWQAYLAAKQAKDSTAMANVTTAWSADLPDNGADPAQTSTASPIVRSLLLQAYCRLFAILFWFTVFGWMGALVYRLVAQCRVTEPTEDVDLTGFSKASAWLQSVLDWIPSRVFALTLMVVGAFSPAFGIWIRHIISGLGSSYPLIVDTAIAALSSPATATDEALVGKEAALLIERSLIVWVVIVALLTIGHLIV